MAGTVTETIEQYSRKSGVADTIVANFAVVADDSDGSVPATAFSSTLMGLVKGYFLFAMITVPGTPQPTADYDITLVGGTTSLDLLGGVGIDRAADTAEQVLPKIGTTEVKRLIDETPTLTIENNSVNEAEITVRLIFLRNF